MRTTDRWRILFGWAHYFAKLIVYLLTHPKRTTHVAKSEKRPRG